MKNSIILLITLSFGIRSYAKDDISLKTEEIKYITAKSGLIYRDKPKGKRLGKFEFNEKIIITEHTNVFQEIKNGNETIKGEWLGTKLNNKTVYVFGGFLSDTKAKISIEQEKKYLQNGIWVSEEFRTILEETKLYSKASFYRDCPHNIIFYGNNKVCCWSENQMEEQYLKLNNDLEILDIGEILTVNNSFLSIKIDNKKYKYFKINIPMSSIYAVFEVVREGSGETIKKWFSGNYTLSSGDIKRNITFDLNSNIYFDSWYEDYDNDIKIDVIEFQGNLYKVDSIEDDTYYLKGIKPFEDIADPEVIPTGREFTLKKNK